MVWAEERIGENRGFPVSADVLLYSEEFIECKIRVVALLRMEVEWPPISRFKMKEK